jgi:hypothetical protein
MQGFVEQERRRDIIVASINQIVFSDPLDIVALLMIVMIIFYIPIELSFDLNIS